MRKNTRPARRATATKVIASVALLAGAASVAGMGTFGAFTDTTTADQKVTTGTIDLNGPTGELSAKVEGMVPGDSLQRKVTLTRAKGSQTFGSLKLTTIPGGDAVLTEAGKGLQLKVEECPEQWTEVVKDKTFTCKGTTEGNGTSVYAGDVIVAAQDLPAPLGHVNADNATSYLRVTLSLPNTTAPQNDLQGKTATIGFQFDATQRAGEFR